ncbi:unnamed protein product [Miscanthus lutarioriparius]|uniref:Riboflavin biosynthesis protein PYRD, chloroplastic n=1 Tax=Miscanthus lutarioriparius TaxID=422564 RepID=A0A811M5B4_9POAL|nr:unnamed protein product [Miscanthus lutarioriparius]
MASSLVSRPHLTQRTVRAATLASPTRARLAAGAGALGGHAVRCQAQAAGDLDAHYMRRCVELARKAAGYTSPNPMVGCIIVRDGRVVGEGFHPKAGQPHAEVFALRDAGNLAENATAYVSLEPCNHYGRTPPCTEALINAKVKEVVVGMTDPNPIVASKGIEKLQGAGINVRVGVEEALCRKLNEAYIHRMLTGKAFATLRATLSVNGIVTNHIGKGADQSDVELSLPLSPSGANQPLYIIVAQGENSRLHIPSLSEENASKVIVLADSPVTVEPAGVEVAVLRQIDLESILQLLAQRGLCKRAGGFQRGWRKLCIASERLPGGQAGAEGRRGGPAFLARERRAQQPGIWWQPIVSAEELGAQGGEWECAAGGLCVVSLLSEIDSPCGSFVCFSPVNR